MALRYIEIKEMILDMLVQMEAHSRIPSRTALCKQFLVTRTTVDRAISELIGEGQLYSVDGSGTYVSDLGAEGAPIKRNQMNIGVLLPNIMHDTYPGFLRGIEDVAEAQGINVMICNTDNSSSKQISYIKRLLNSKVNGIIIIPAVNNDQDYDLHKLLQQAIIPVVFANRSSGGFNVPLICSNDYYGGYIATKHLLKMGYKKISYLSPKRYRISTDRYYGYLAAHWEAGVPVDEDLVIFMDNRMPKEIHEGLYNLMKRHKDIDGVFCFNDYTALYAAEAIKAHNLRISDDVGLVGYDNTQGCEMVSVRLTSVSYRNYEIGSRAAQTILQMINNPDHKSALTVFQPEIIVRDSCLGKRNLD